MSGVRFQRGNHVVANLERALTFYQGVLGFEVTYILPPKAESYSYPVFDIPRSAQMRFCALSTDTQERVMALTEVTGVALTALAHPRRSAIVLEIQDPDAVIAGARGLGLQVYDEEILKTQDGRTGREIGIVDFDDNLVVIYKINGGTST
ncbi:MAG: VOC family protein [Betaproteobacteria bacterium]|jgi:catechol 2,3-dioxygenase-like lactoylglutathione lyase family enzyme|nr:VOC family protein [Betaproteobacteria bacterium]